MYRIIFLVIVHYANSKYSSKYFCGTQVLPLEEGSWKHDLSHMDSAIVENRPVSLSEGQVYVYENYFPNRTIKYIHVDNLARKSCGASANIKSGGVGTSSVLIVLHSDANQEIRSVIDIWGTKNLSSDTADRVKAKEIIRPDHLRTMTSLYLFKDMRTVNHNLHNT